MGRHDSNSPDPDFPGDAAPAMPPTEHALRAEGGAGGRSGTGQAQPHHGYDEREGQGALGQPVDPESMLPEAPVGPDYQSGGRGQDHELQVDERKTGGLGDRKGRDPRGGADPAPGAPVQRGR